MEIFGNNYIMAQKNILLICGTLNQTTMMHKISRYLEDYNCYFTPYYGNQFINLLAQAGLCDFCSLGGQAKESTLAFLAEHDCVVDFGGMAQDYDLVITCSDLIIPKNIADKPIIHVQEGMVDPEKLAFYLVKYLKMPRYIANTSTMGLSNAYEKFCVMSEGWKEIFIEKGVDAEKIAVTGVPNFDNVDQFRDNDFPHMDFVLAATSCLRETFKYENRKKFIQKVLDIAEGKEVIFKLHPNEKMDRAIAEIEKWAPDSTIYTDGNINHMIANCDTLVTRYSSVLMIASAMQKPFYSDLDYNYVKKITPIQNEGRSAENIANLGKIYLDG